MPPGYQEYLWEIGEDIKSKLKLEDMVWSQRLDLGGRSSQPF